MTHMQQSFEILDKVTYLMGNVESARRLSIVPAMKSFDEKIIDFLNDVSRELMRNRAAKSYSDVVAFGFWIRKSSVLGFKERFKERNGEIRLGKGVVFHIAPSNVPVNFAYSLVLGLLTGNANVVRVPSREFPQVKIIIDAFNTVLEWREDIKPYAICVRYGHEKKINDAFSSMADMRIVWGGDTTIDKLRQSPLPPRTGEVTFADRYSLAVIDSDSYMEIEDKSKVAEDFYNDTFFSDQNACTSPRIVVWIGNRKNEAKGLFWEEEHRVVKKKYRFQDIQSVNKLAKSYLIAAIEPGVKIEEHLDNLIIRVSIPKITDNLMDYQDNSGYFYEYDCEDILDLSPLCNNKRCQTIGYIGDSSVILPLVNSGVKGIDRVVPIGKTMDFDLIWDGYNLPSLLTRTIVFS